jgi:hypothetical protein
LRHQVGQPTRAQQAEQDVPWSDENFLPLPINSRPQVSVPGIISTAAAVTPSSTSSTFRGGAVFLANSAIRTANSWLVDVIAEGFPL